MKRFVLVVAALVMSAFAANAQIEFRRLEGEALIMKARSCEVQPFGKKAIEYFFVYDSRETSNDAVYALEISYVTKDKGQAIPDGGKLLLRLGDGTVLELQDCGRDGIVDYSTEWETQPTSHRYSSRYNKGTEYIYFGRYPMTVEQYRSVIENGIAKIRVQTLADMVECEYDDALVQKIRDHFQKTDGVLEFHMDPTKNM